MQRSQEMILQQLMNNSPAIKNNPMIANALQMAQRGDTNNLRTLAENIAKEKGVNIAEIARQYGIKL